MSFENRNFTWATALVDELARSGLRHVCICPGSRSGPLALALARHDGIRKWFHLDERSASFFALGMAQALDEPVAVLCSSGTAAANFYPAVIEASYSATPLLLLTADRPPELWEWGAPQTMDQTRLFGQHAKWAVSLPSPEVSPERLRSVRFLANRAYATASEPPAGPVHINVPLAEPLAPRPVPEDLQMMEMLDSPEAWRGRDGPQPFARVGLGRRSGDAATISALAQELAAAERGLIVCGWQRSPEFPSLVTELAHRLGYPVLADPLSQVRTGGHDLSQVIDNYDRFLADLQQPETLDPEVIIRFGAVPTSKNLTEFLERSRSARHILVGDAAWSDPSHLSTDVLRVNADGLCRSLIEKVSALPRSGAWLERWLIAREITEKSTIGALKQMEELFEGKVFSELTELLPDGSTLFAGNSMPIRDMDAFLPRTNKALLCTANRGMNGIDGVVSTALGYAAAQPETRVVLVIGDVSLYHDMNGLLAARRHDLNATVVVLNNDGGGIFSFLPQADYPEHFEDLFGTPHGLGFEATATLYRLAYAKVDSWKAFQSAVSTSLDTPGTTIIEVPGDRARNVVLHQQVRATVTGQDGA